MLFPVWDMLTYAAVGASGCCWAGPELGFLPQISCAQPSFVASKWLARSLSLRRAQPGSGGRRRATEFCHGVAIEWPQPGGRRRRLL